MKRYQIQTNELIYSQHSPSSDASLYLDMHLRSSHDSLLLSNVIGLFVIVAASLCSPTCRWCQACHIASIVACPDDTSPRHGFSWIRNSMIGRFVTFIILSMFFFTNWAFSHQICSNASQVVIWAYITLRPSSFLFALVTWLDNCKCWIKW